MLPAPILSAPPPPPKLSAPPPRAWEGLGRLSYTGKGVPQLYNSALRSFREVVEQGAGFGPPELIRNANYMAEVVAATIQKVCPLVGQRIVVVGGPRLAEFQPMVYMTGHVTQERKAELSRTRYPDLSPDSLEGRTGTALDFGHGQRNPGTSTGRLTHILRFL